MDIHNFINVLSSSISPTILISGLGLILLSMTNRLARPIDRIRALCTTYKTASARDRKHIKEQIEIFQLRSRLLQKAISLIVLSIFLVSTLMVFIFLSIEFNISLLIYLKVFFVLALLSTILGLILFIYDTHLTLKSINIEVNETLID